MLYYRLFMNLFIAKSPVKLSKFN